MVSQYSLPPELWTVVFQMIPEPYHYRQSNDLENVRLTCKMFEKLATPFSMPRIICTPLSNSLARLTAVSRHPVLSRSVKEVVYACNRYDFFETLREYEEALRIGAALSSRTFEEPKSEEDNLDLQTAYSLYIQTCNDQATMEDSGELIDCLCSALMRMPHIEKITISPNIDFYLDGHTCSRYFLEPDPAYNEAFLLMARVLSLTGTAIRELDIESDADDVDELHVRNGGVDGELFGGLSHINLNHCCAAFRGLRSLRIIAGSDDNDGWMTGNLYKILSEATDLERIYVQGAGWIFDVSTKYIFGTTAWSRLTSLTFYKISFYQGDLLNLLKRHSGTLKEVQLLRVSLENGSWKTILEEMKSSLSLQHISITQPYEIHNVRELYLDSDRKPLHDYFFGDGPYPLSDRPS